MAVRSSTHQAGGVVLEKLVNRYRGPRIDCGQGHLAEFVDYPRVSSPYSLPFKSGGPTTTARHVSEV